MVRRVVLLDAGPLGLVTNPNQSSAGIACANWLDQLVSHGSEVFVPEITDYEIRRELLRANKQKGLKRLDDLIGIIGYLPINTEAMREAAFLWAQARRKGEPTADDKALDSDVILAAQARTIKDADVVIATTNVGHLSRFASASLWTEIQIH